MALLAPPPASAALPPTATVGGLGASDAATNDAPEPPEGLLLRGAGSVCALIGGVCTLVLEASCAPLESWHPASALHDSEAAPKKSNQTEHAERRDHTRLLYTASGPRSEEMRHVAEGPRDGRPVRQLTEIVDGSIRRGWSGTDR